MMPAILDGFESVPHGFFDRTNGLSKGAFEGLNVARSVGDEQVLVDENRLLALEAIGRRDAPFIFAGPLAHGNKVYVVKTDDEKKDIEGFDGIVSNIPGVTIGLSVADCVPVLLYDPVHEAVGVIHAGWRGLVNGVVAATAKSMSQEYGTQPFDIRAAVGPCMCGKDYEVGEEVAEQFDSEYISQEDSSLYLDMRGQIVQQLNSAGITTIVHDNRCTFENDDLFSYRQNKVTGRQLAVVGL